MSTATKKVARILVVEDDQPTRELLCDHLSADQFDTTGAETVEKADQCLAGSEYDLMLLDLTMPDDALGLLRRVRSHDDDCVSNMGLIIVSGRGTERDRIRALGEGADDYVLKPFSYGELLARINAVLRRSRNDEPVSPVGQIASENKTREATDACRHVRLSVNGF